MRRVIAAVLLLLTGCYDAHLRSSDGSAPGRDGSATRPDTARPDEPDASDECATLVSGSEPPRPVLWWPLATDLRNRGTLPGHDGVARGPVSHVSEGPGGALRLAGVEVVFSDTAVVLMGARALTFSAWVRAPVRAEGRQWLACRSYGGFETYRGVTHELITTCAGARIPGEPDTWDGCGSVGAVAGGWAHFVLRWRGRGAPPEIGVDGGTLVPAISFGPPSPEYGLFDEVTDLATGGGAGDGDLARGEIFVADVRVYAEALDDDDVWIVSTCPVAD